MLTFGGIPVPLSGTLCIGGVALSAKSSEAVSAALVEGVNVSVTMHVPPFGATPVPATHVFVVIAKSAALAPESWGAAVKLRATLPGFVRVTVMAALVVNCGTLLNARFIGRPAAAPRPEPLRGTACGLPGELSLMASVDDRLP